MPYGSWTMVTLVSNCIVSDIVDELDALMIQRMVGAPLQNATSMAVSCNLDTISGYSIVNELSNGYGISDA